MISKEREEEARNAEEENPRTRLYCIGFASIRYPRKVPRACLVSTWLSGAEEEKREWREETP
jgi:hypothetical protein